MRCLCPAVAVAGEELAVAEALLQNLEDSSSPLLLKFLVCGLNVAGHAAKEFDHPVVFVPGW